LLNSPLLGDLSVVGLVTSVREDVGAADGQAGTSSPATLDDHDATLAVVVTHGRLAHLLVRYGTSGAQERVAWAVEVEGFCGRGAS
jgi:hypothetical protein